MFSKKIAIVIFVVIALSMLAAQCGGPPPTPQIVKETVVVKETVQVEVEKKVEVEKIVTKEVEKVVEKLVEVQGAISYPEAVPLSLTAA